MNHNVDLFFENTKQWQDELYRLRDIVLDCGLTELFKWKVPCYTFQNKNILIIHGFKEYFALLFFNGALLQDELGILIQQTKNVQAGRQIRFTNLDEIDKLENVIKAYIYEAIEVEKAGLKVILKNHSEYTIPEELSIKFEENSELKNAFFALTPGRQRAYLLYFSDSKQSITRKSRIDKYVDRILNGKGLNDCICGFSKKN